MVQPSSLLDFTLIQNLTYFSLRVVSLSSFWRTLISITIIIIVGYNLFNLIKFLEFWREWFLESGLVTWMFSQDRIIIKEIHLFILLMRFPLVQIRKYFGAEFAESFLRILVLRFISHKYPHVRLLVPDGLLIGS